MELPLFQSGPAAKNHASIHEELERFDAFGTTTRVSTREIATPAGDVQSVAVYENEFWTARQRQCSSLHEVSYRACFKPQLPRFFIERLTQPGEVVYDPFMGRGTTLIEAALSGRVPMGNDINPLSKALTGPRLNPPTLQEVARRLETIPLDQPGDMPEDLLVFYHPETLRQVSSLRRYLFESGRVLDAVDEWIAMVSLNRLTGHSNGFFSVYTLPPNQAVSVASQRKINAKRNQTPEPRDVRKIILKKSKQLMGDVDCGTRQVLHKVAANARMFKGPAAVTPELGPDSVALVVTSPPFLNIVQYATDNWLRCWFMGIDSSKVEITVPRRVEDWSAAMTEVLRECARVLRKGGHIAWEVGEVNKGTLKLEDVVLPAGLSVGLTPLLVLINDQEFTKTANCWGVDNMGKGTNTNRIVLFRKA